MSFEADMSRIAPDIVVVHLSGSIASWPPGDEKGLPLVNDLLYQNEKKLILDISGIESMDSSGIQLMFDCYSTIQRAGGEMRLAGANPRLARLFRITQLDNILPLYPTVETALQDFTLKARA